MKHKYYHDALDFFSKHYRLHRKDFPVTKQMNWTSLDCYKESRNASFDFVDNKLSSLTWVILKKHLGHYQWNDKDIPHPIQKYYAVIFLGSQWLSLYTGVPHQELWDKMAKTPDDVAQALLWLYHNENLSHLERVLLILKEDWKNRQTVDISTILHPQNMGTFSDYP